MMCLLLGEEKDVILVVVDRFSKLAMFGTTKTTATIVKTSTLFFDMWVRHHGMPEVIVSDRDAKFALEFRTLLMKKARTKLKFGTPCHLQTNGQTNGSMRYQLNQYIRNYVATYRKDWGHKLNLAEFCYNSTTHLATQMSPFKLALGMKVKQPLDLVVPYTMGYHKNGGKNAKIMVKEHKGLNTHAKKFLEEAQTRYEK